MRCTCVDTLFHQGMWRSIILAFQWISPALASAAAAIDAVVPPWIHARVCTGATFIGKHYCCCHFLIKHFLVSGCNNADLFGAEAVRAQGLKRRVWSLAWAELPHHQALQAADDSAAVTLFCSVDT